MHILLDSEPLIVNALHITFLILKMFYRIILQFLHYICYGIIFIRYKFIPVQFIHIRQDLKQPSVLLVDDLHTGAVFIRESQHHRICMNCFCLSDQRVTCQNMAVKPEGQIFHHIVENPDPPAYIHGIQIYAVDL